MLDEENTLDSIVVLPDPILSAANSNQMLCLNQENVSSSFTNSESIEQQNRNLRTILNTLRVENFDLKLQLQKLTKREAFVDVDSAYLIERIEKNLIETNKMFDGDCKLKDSMQFLVQNLWSSIAFHFSDLKLLNLTKVKDEILNKLDKSNQEFRIDLNKIGKQMEILHSNNLKLKSKLQEQNKILNRLSQLWTTKTTSENSKLIIQNLNATTSFLNFNFNQHKLDLVDFLKCEIFEQKKFFLEKMLPIINDGLFFESEKNILDYVSEFYKNEDLLCKIKHDKKFPKSDLISKFERIIERIISAKDLIDDRETQNSKILSSLLKSLIRINLMKFSNQSESIIHNIYSGLYRLLRLTTIFDKETKEELGGDVIDRLIIPVLDSASIIFDIFVMNIYGIINQELNFMTAMVLTSASNDMEKHLKSFMSIYIKIYKIIHQKVLDKSLKKNQIGPNGENILNYLCYLELVKDLTIAVCGSLTRKFVAYEPDHQLIRNFLLRQKNDDQSTWLMRLKENFLNSDSSDFSFIKCTEKKFSELILNCCYSTFLTTLDFTKKSDVSIGKFAIYHFSACFNPKSMCSDPCKILEDSSFNSEID